MVSATFLVLEKREKFFFVLSFQSLEIKFGAQPDLFVFISFPGIEKKNGTRLRWGRRTLN